MDKQHDENAANARLTGKFDAIAAAGNPKKHELQATVGFFNTQVTKLQQLRRRENAAQGRDNSDDDILDILDLMETRCLKMGCFPDRRRY
jgi:hypothetical protein